MGRKESRNERRRNNRHLNRLNSPSPPRAPNRFILYRRYIQSTLFNDPDNPIGMRELSRAIAKMWKEEPDSVKNYWDQVANSSSFGVIPGLDISNTSTFVNATASSAETHQRN